MGNIDCSSCVDDSLQEQRKAQLHGFEFITQTLGPLQCSGFVGEDMENQMEKITWNMKLETRVSSGDFWRWWACQGVKACLLQIYARGVLTISKPS